MRKIIISGITLFCLLLSVFTVKTGLPLFKIPAMKEIKSTYDETTVSIGKLKQFKEEVYGPADLSLTETVKSYNETRKMYNDVSATKTEEEKQKAQKAQAYDLEYLWIKIGNYAYKNKADLTMEIYKTEEQETDDDYIKCDLKFRTISSYSGAKQFIEDISVDSELQFIPENLKMTSEWKEINVLTDADKTTPLILNEYNNKATETNYAGKSLRKLLLVTEFYKSDVPVSKSTLLKIENTQTVEAEKKAAEEAAKEAAKNPNASATTTTTNTNAQAATSN